MRSRYLLFFALSSLLLSARSAPQVTIGQTTLSGRDIQPLGVDFFGGIPYAEAPVGDRRFKSPVLRTRLASGTLEAAEYGKACLQPGNPAGMSEDCLTINIYRPAGISSKAKLPVMFWTYGGGFIVGSSARFNGSHLVAYSVERGTPIIYVNFNYRLGALGYPQGQEAEDKRHINLALQDQIAALEWVQENIHHFGGDKRKVTAFGESAGAMMTSILSVNRKLDKLARAAIFQSGSANSPNVYRASRRESLWQTFVSRVPSCSALASSGNTFDCLRNANSSEIHGAMLASLAGAGEMFPWNPVLDTRKDGLYPDLVSKQYASGRFSKIPYIAGTNLDEGTFFASKSPNSTEGTIRGALTAAYSPSRVSASALDVAINRLFQLYPDSPSLGAPYGSGDELFGLPPAYKRDSALQGDLTIDAPRRMWTEAAAQAGVKGYGYLFTQRLQIRDPALGVNHTAEIPFVYGQSQDPAPSTQTLSKRMMDYWISFVVNLDPNDKKGSQRPNWPQYTTRSKNLLQLNGEDTKVIKDDFRLAEIGFINENAVLFHH
ncbi:triacylglycerol lipase 3 [Coprinopsis marcescibilis]|uniref:Triacylglycerol lipase 3 n=1 Tax=Coprinopsis marcescibilis TaxID=230819 RepID=A0A5C3L699_COPMA|nr:triacylglycerol lipase 3 [Coprinopsis marcescibilis]